MPIYEYRCKKCGHEFEELVSSSDSTAPECPSCHAAETERMVSRPCRYCGGGSSINPEAYARAASAGGGCAGCAGGHCASCGH